MLSPRVADSRGAGSFRPGLVWLFAAILLGGYGYLLCDMAVRSAGGSDSSGYLNSARLFAEGRFSEAVDPLSRFGLPQEDIRIFIPLGFSPASRPGRMVPSYPPGLPLHMAAAGLLGGWKTAPFWVSPLCAVAGLTLIYAIGRELGLSPTFAAATPILLAAFPTFLSYGLQPMSDVPATAWALAAVLAALRSRRRLGAAFLCGATLGMAVLVRPTNILLAAPLLLALPARPGVWLRALLGGLPLAVFLAAYNQICNGSPWISGYGAVATSFSLAPLPQRAIHYGYWLGILGTPLLPLGWLAVSGVRRLPWRDRAFLVLWFAVFFLFYSSYDPYDTWWYTRFLLPALPAMILSVALVAECGLSRMQRSPPESRIRKVLLLLVCAAAIAAGVHWTRRFALLKAYRGERTYPEACRWAESKVPPRALVISMQMSGALKYYTDLTPVRWDWIQPEQVSLLRERGRAEGDRWYALLFPFENEQLEKRLPWGWTKLATLRDVTLWRVSE